MILVLFWTLMAAGILYGGLEGCEWLIRRLHGRLPWPARRITNWPVFAVFFTLFWIFVLMVACYSKTESTPGSVSLSTIWLNAAIPVGLWLMLLNFLRTDGLTLQDFGVTGQAGRWQMLVGIAAFVALLGPTICLLRATMPWRTEGTEHILLQVLRSESGLQALLPIAVAVVVAAPLFEELLFRVVLQEWLAAKLTPTWGVLLAAGLFSMVHGALDGACLLPFSLVQGVVFRRTRCYLAVVTTHALFNGFMLISALIQIAGSSGS